MKTELHITIMYFFFIFREEHYDEIGYERPTDYQELENIRPAPNVYDRLGKPKEPVSYIYLRWNLTKKWLIGYVMKKDIHSYIINEDVKGINEHLVCNICDVTNDVQSNNVTKTAAKTNVVKSSFIRT